MHATEGYTGADLQALVYNAHLEVVHASITVGRKPTSPEPEETPVVYTILGGVESVVSRAEEAELERRVRSLCLCL